MLREGEVAGICYAHDALWIATGKEIYRYRDLNQVPELDVYKRQAIASGTVNMIISGSLKLSNWAARIR